MKTLKKTLIAIASIGSLMAPMGLGAVAHAQQAPGPGYLHCQVLDEFIEEDLPFCDLSLMKEVSVNGGSFVDADTAGDAVAAHVGDQVTWKITVSNSGISTPTGIGSITVDDVLPAGVTFVSSTGSDGSSFNTSLNQWIFPLASIISSSSVTLTITTQAATVGLAQNIATIAFRDPGSCDGNRCAYGDNDPDNDSDEAWADISAPPQVLADTTTTGSVLAATGIGANASIAAGGLIIATLAVTFIGRKNRSF